MTSREFNQDTGRAKRAALVEPVLITDRAKPTHVLLSYDDFRSLTDHQHSLADLLALPPEHADIELPLVTAPDLATPADLS